MVHTANVGDKIARGEVVRPPCENKTNGHWFCITHKKPFGNQLQKDTHIDDDKTHVLAWLCNEHGPEQP